MIYIELFLGFLKVGCFAFGAYAAIPLIRETVLYYGWISEDMLSYMIAVSESTPGPIMINLATYIGKSQAGFLGAVVATVATVLPSFAVILLITILMKNILERPYVKAAMKGIEPCVIGIILGTGIYMIGSHMFSIGEYIACNVKNIVFTVVLAMVMILYKKWKKKQISPILFLILAAVLGMVML